MEATDGLVKLVVNTHQGRVDRRVFLDFPHFLYPEMKSEFRDRSSDVTPGGPYCVDT